MDSTSNSSSNHAGTPRIRSTKPYRATPDREFSLNSASSTDWQRDEVGSEELNGGSTTGDVFIAVVNTSGYRHAASGASNGSSGASSGRSFSRESAESTDTYCTDITLPTWDDKLVTDEEASDTLVRFVKSADGLNLIDANDLALEHNRLGNQLALAVGTHHVTTVRISSNVKDLQDSLQREERLLQLAREAQRTGTEIAVRAINENFLIFLGYQSSKIDCEVPIFKDVSRSAFLTDFLSTTDGQEMLQQQISLPQSCFFKPQEPLSSGAEKQLEILKIWSSHLKSRGKMHPGISLRDVAASLYDNIIALESKSSSDGNKMNEFNNGIFAALAEQLSSNVFYVGNRAAHDVSIDTAIRTIRFIRKANISWCNADVLETMLCLMLNWKALPVKTAAIPASWKLPRSLNDAVQSLSSFLSRDDNSITAKGRQWCKERAGTAMAKGLENPHAATAIKNIIVKSEVFEELKGDCDLHTKRITALEERSKKLEAANTMALARDKEMDLEFKSLHNRIADLEKSLSEEKLHVETKKCKISNLDNRIDSLEKSLIKEKGQVETKEGKISKLDKKVKDQASVIVQLTQGNTSLKRELHDSETKLKEAAAAASKEGEKLRGVNKFMMDRINELKKENAGQEVDLRAQAEKIRTQYEQLQAQDKQLRDQDKELRDQDKRLHDQDTQIREQEERIQQQDKKLKIQEELLNAQRDVIQHLEEENARLYAELKAQREQTAKLQIRVNEMEEEIKCLKAKFSQDRPGLDNDSLEDANSPRGKKSALSSPRRTTRKVGGLVTQTSTIFETLGLRKNNSEPGPAQTFIADAAVKSLQIQLTAAKEEAAEHKERTVVLERENKELKGRVSGLEGKLQKFDDFEKNFGGLEEVGRKLQKFDDFEKKFGSLEEIGRKLQRLDELESKMEKFDRLLARLGLDLDME